MPRKTIDEAIVLRSFNVGEGDRFLILLTKHAGRITARACGVRKPGSQRCAGLLPLHRVSITLDHRSTGTYVAATECIDPLMHTWRDPQRFSLACEASELLMRLLEEHEPVPDIYAATVTFLSSLHAPAPPLQLSLFTLSILSHLGHLSPVTHSCVSHGPIQGITVWSSRFSGFCSRAEDPAGLVLSEQVLSLLSRGADASLSMTALSSHEGERELQIIVQSLLGSQLGLSLSSTPVSRAISSGVTPICQ